MQEGVSKQTFDALINTSKKLSKGQRMSALTIIIKQLEISERFVINTYIRNLNISDGIEWKE